jgi:hypothetical protein
MVPSRPSSFYARCEVEIPSPIDCDLQSSNFLGHQCQRRSQRRLLRSQEDRPLQESPKGSIHSCKCSTRRRQVMPLILTLMIDSMPCVVTMHSTCFLNVPLDFVFRSAVTPRLMRHFHLLNIPDLAVSTMQRIFSSIMQVIASRYVFGLRSFRKYMDIYRLESVALKFHRPERTFVPCECGNIKSDLTCLLQ